MTDRDCSPRRLLERLKEGDDAAAAAVFSRFGRRLIALARRQLDTRLRGKLDPEDVVQSVFRSFFRRQREEQFELTDWGNLWSLLALITVRKCTNVRARFGRQARDIHLEVSADAAGNSSADGWECLCREPTPAEAAALTEMVEQLLGRLPSRDREIVVMRLDGKTTREISAAINRAERTVRRVVENFRGKLEKAALAVDSK